jgi:hypothetical protein
MTAFARRPLSLSATLDLLVARYSRRGGPTPRSDK